MVTAGVVTLRPLCPDGLYGRAGQLDYNKGRSCVCECVCVREREREREIHLFNYIFVYM